jgi:hypothetical protein
MVHDLPEPVATARRLDGNDLVYRTVDQQLAKIASPDASSRRRSGACVRAGGTLSQPTSL